MLLVVVYNYYKCLKSVLLNYEVINGVEFGKSNILLIGLIGSGKILLVEILVCCLNVLFVVVDVIILI